MEWLIGIIIVGYLLVKLTQGTGHKVPKTAYPTEREAQALADEVTTPQQFRALEKKLERAEERLGQQSTERAYEKACRQHEVLQAAVDLAQAKIGGWQFVPDIGLHTPSHVLAHAYKVYSGEEYRTIKAELHEYDDEWYPIQLDDEKEDPVPSINSLIEFRSIVESNCSREEMIEKINAFVAKHKRKAAIRELFEAHFDFNDSLTPGDQWFAEKLREAGLPLAFELYREGYTTPEKCLEIDPVAFASRKGVGPKKATQLKQFQAAMQDSDTSITP